jgi:hypothetical protein
MSVKKYIRGVKTLDNGYFNHFELSFILPFTQTEIISEIGDRILILKKCDLNSFSKLLHHTVCFLLKAVSFFTKTQVSVCALI